MGASLNLRRVSLVFVLLTALEPAVSARAPIQNSPAPEVQAPADGLDSESGIRCLIEAVRAVEYGSYRSAPRPPSSPLERGSLVLDTNVASALFRDSSQPNHRYVIQLLEKMTGIPRQRLARPNGLKSPLWLTEPSVKEASVARSYSIPPGHHRVQLEVNRDSARYRSVLAQLRESKVGRNKGQIDQLILTDLFFARRSAGAIPTFVTMDRGIFNPLCELSPSCGRLGGGGTLYDRFPDGFEVELTDSSGIRHSIRVIAVPSP